MQSYANLLNDSSSIRHLRQQDIERHGQDICSQWMLESESVTGWQTPVTQTKPITNNKKKSKRSEKNLGSDRKPAFLYSDGAFDNSIDKYTYRYIPNNGCYRTRKLMSGNGRPCYGYRKPASPLLGTSSSSEHKKLQRDITRDLRREFRHLLQRNRTYFQIDDGTVASEEEMMQSEKEKYDTRVFDDDGEHDHIIDKVQRLVEPISTGRVMETHSAQAALETQPGPPPPVRLEDLLIKKRCSTNLEKLKSSAKDQKPVKQESSTMKSAPQLKTLPLPQFAGRFKCVNIGELEELATKTFNNRKSYQDTRAKQLRPVEKVTPSMREVYDNSKAMDEMMKLECLVQSSDEDTAPVVRLQPPFDPKLNVTASSFTQPKQKSLNSMFKSTAAASSSQLLYNYSVGRLGDPSLDYPALHDIDPETSGKFPSFLPSICGKRITTKLASLR